MVPDRPNYSRRSTKEEYAFIIAINWSLLYNVRGLLLAVMNTPPDVTAGDVARDHYKRLRPSCKQGIGDFIGAPRTM